MFESGYEFFLHADYAESAEFFIFFSVLRWRWRDRKLRYDERAQRVYPPPPPCGVLTPVSGGESVTTENTAQADCPPETGATRSEATEGVDVFIILLVYFFILVLLCVLCRA